MFGRSLSEVLEILGIVIVIGIVCFLGIWPLVKDLNINLGDVFGNINLPS